MNALPKINKIEQCLKRLNRDPGTLAEQVSTKLVVLALGISVNKQSFHVGKVFRIWILRKVDRQKNSVLFVCVENAGRSQMAEGFFRKYSPERYEPLSGGTRPTSASTLLQ